MVVVAGAREVVVVGADGRVVEVVVVAAGRVVGVVVVVLRGRVVVVVGPLCGGGAPAGVMVPPMTTVTRAG